MNALVCADDDCSVSGIEVRNLNLSYGGTTAFRDFSFDIKPCSVTAFIGPSGCGKSSFLNCLNRMTDYDDCCQVSGSITIDGENILSSSLNTVVLRKKVGMIFQKPNPFPMSIRRNIDLPLKYHGMGKKTDREQKLQQCLREAGLWEEVKDRLDESALSLSGGQQQRLCIARAIALEPEVLLMDEPCSALDPVASQKVEQLIQNLRKKYTVVVVTHNLAQARRISDQTIVVWTKNGAGYVVDAGETERVFTAPRDQVSASYISGQVG